MTLSNIVLEEILENQVYKDKDTGTTYRVEYANQNRYRHECFIWKDNKRFMLTAPMRSMRMAFTVAAAAIAGNVLP